MAANGGNPDPEPVALSLDEMFAIGGNRMCFVHPSRPDWCLKVNRVDRSPAFKKRKSKWWKRFRRLSSFDDNLREAEVLKELAARHPGEDGRVIPACHGWVETRFGRALASTLFRDDDGQIAATLEYEIFRHGMSPALKVALEEFFATWRQLRIPSRQLLLHNLLCIRRDGGMRIAVIDGLESRWGLGLGRAFPKKRIERRLERLTQLIQEFETRHQTQDLSGRSYLEKRLNPLPLSTKRRVLGLDQAQT